jgi:hypothetical protein
MNYYFHNEFHLGDNVFNLIFFNNLKNYLVKNNIKINYYCQPNYIDQLQEFINFNNVIIQPISNKPNNSIQLWIENKEFVYTFTKIREISSNNGQPKLDYNTFYKNFFNLILSKLNILFKFKNFYYEDNDLLIRYDKLNEKYKNIDILIVNSQPLSDQYKYNKSEWDNYICVLNKLYNVVTTTKVNNEIKCTTDDNFTIKTIAAISTKVPIIIAINSGVVPGLLNKYTLKNVKQMYTFDDRSLFSYPNFSSREKITDISFDELDIFLVKKNVFEDKFILETNEIPVITKEIAVITKEIAVITKEIPVITKEILINTEEEKELKKKYLNFDWEVYLHFNKDLLIDKNDQMANSEAWKHFINYGINEKRIYSFDWINYIDNNNLILAVKNKNDALNHMIENNNSNKYINENNDINNIKNIYYKLFDWEYYVNNNNDLSYITNYNDAFNHYLKYGENENRKISDFNWMDYLLVNKDLIKNGIITEIKAIKHWLKHGKNENRSYK